MSGRLKDVKTSIDKKPHKPYGEHIDIITPLPEIRGADKIRIGTNGETLTEEILLKGKYRKKIQDNI